MSRAIITIVSLVLLTVSKTGNCQAKKISPVTAKKMSPPITKKAIHSQPAIAVIEFLKWYRAESNDISKIGLVNYPEGGVDSLGNVTDSSKFYTVDFNGAGDYLLRLASSGFLSENYIAGQRAYFKNADKAFHQFHAYDGPPEGFDADLVMLSQDYDLADVEKARSSTKMKTPSSATVRLVFGYNQLVLLYNLSLQDDQWKIDEIKNVSR